MRTALLLAVLLAAGSARAQAPAEPYAVAAARILDAALADSAAYQRIAYAADTFGPRFTGSAALEGAVEWAVETMRADGLENVRAQPVAVPVWVRGAESAALVTPTGEVDLPMLGLGGSVGTGPDGLTAEVLVVGSYDDLAARADEAEGRIVLFDVPYEGYGRTVGYRVGGADAASNAGAVASLVRSVGPQGLSTPHTGTMRYGDDVRPIPHAAITAEASAILRRIQDRGDRPVVRLTMAAETHADGLSHNVIGEVVGRELPGEVVIAGGHYDSWDVGQGVHDDLAGTLVCWEAVRLLKALGLRPRRTVRAVLWTNEENGLRGGEVFRDSLGPDVSHVQLALESDSGLFEPVGFGYGGSAAGQQMLAAIVDPLIAGVVAHDAEAGPAGVTMGGGGADIGPMMRDGVPGLSLRTDNGDYFLYHHTPADTLDKLDAAHVQRAVAMTAILLYVAAEMPERLPHGE